MTLGGLVYVNKGMSKPRPKAKAMPKTDQIASTLSAADAAEKRIAAGFVRSIKNIRDRVSEDDLTSLIQRGGASINSLFDPTLLAHSFAPMKDAIIQAVGQGAALAAKQSGLPIKPIKKAQTNVADFVLAGTNPRLKEFALTQTSQRIREVSEGIKQTVRQVISDGTTAGMNPRATARRIRDSIGLTTSQEQIVNNYRNALQTGSTDALTRALRDKRSDAMIRRAIEDNKPLSEAKINSLVERYRDRWINHRAEVIGRTESIRSMSGSAHQLVQQAIDNGEVDPRQIRRFWHFTHDARTRPDHREIPGMNPDGVGQDEPFQTPGGPLMYPCDPAGEADNVINCRCVVHSRVLSREMAGLDELPPEAEPTAPAPYVPEPTIIEPEPAEAIDVRLPNIPQLDFSGISAERAAVMAEEIDERPAISTEVIAPAISPKKKRPKK